MNQHTIEKSVSVEGIGLHTGQLSKIKLVPAPANHGYKFKRTDLEAPKLIPVDPTKVTDTNRGTTIELGGVKVKTIEHLLSALSALSIDNVLIEIEGEEVPILDGSAAAFVELINNAGRIDQEVPRDFLKIEEPINFTDEASGAKYIVLPADKLEVTALLQLLPDNSKNQYFELNSIEDYKAEIAPCQTYVLLSDLEKLAADNLIKGGNLDNAIVFADKKFSKKKLSDLAKKLGYSELKVAPSPNGILNSSLLKFPNEPVRHKILDLIGDLALVNKPILGKVIATQPSHTGNVALAKKLRELYKTQRKLKGKPKYNPDTPPVFDAIKIEQWLPHRYPMLLVDKIIELSDKHVVGIKNVTMNEPFFTGHFPSNPIMPAVLQLEAMAQCGGILAMSLVDEPGNWDTYFLKIDNAKFKNMVVPGDTLILKLELLSPIRRGLCHMQGTAYVGNRIVSEGELTAQIVKRN